MLRVNPDIFSADFEFLLQNKDIMHEANIKSQVEKYSEIHGHEYTEQLGEKYVELIKNVPMFMMSIDQGSEIEANKILIPDNYQLNDIEWCERYMKNTLTGLELWPWEDRIEKGYFRGRPTGVNQNFFPNNVMPDP